MAKKRRKGGRTTPKGTRPLGSGLVPGFSNDEQLGLGAIAAKVLEGARRELVPAPDALQAELWASHVWGMSYGKTLVDLDFEEVLADAFISQAIGRASAEGLAVVRVLAVVAPEPYARRAGRAADEMAATTNLPDPRWVAGLGAWEPTSVLMSSDPVDDDGVTYFIGFRGTGPRPGPEHSIAVYIDHNLMAAKDAFPSAPLAEVERTLTRVAHQEGIVVSSPPVAEAAAHILWAIDATDHTFHPVISDEFSDIRALALARCRSIVGVNVAADVDDAPRMSEVERAALLAEFLASPECADVTRGTDREDVEHLAFHISWYANDYVLGVAMRFSPVMVEIFCVDFAPRKIVGDADDFTLLAQILRGWIRFVGRRRDLPSARIDDALAAVDRWQPEMVSGAGDTAAWGPAKALVAGLDAAGIDLEDGDAVQAWVDQMNTQGGIDAITASIGAPGGEVIPFDGAFDDDEFGGEDEDFAAADSLRQLLAAELGRPAPDDALAVAAAGLRDLFRRRTKLARSIRAGAGIKRAPADDATLVVRVAAAYFTLIDDPGLDIEDQALLMGIEHVDLLAVTVAAVRMGAGTEITPEWCASAVRLADSLLAGVVELDGEPDPDPEASYYVEGGFDLMLPVWREARLLDPADQLTELGVWALPRAVCLAWGYDFDTGSPLA